MNNILSGLFLSPFCCVFLIIGNSQPAAAQIQVKNSPPPCTSVKFKNLSKYKGDHWDKVFSDPQVAPVLKNLLKRKYQNLKSGLAQVDFPDSLSLVNSRGVLTLEGEAPGLYTIMEADLVIEPCGNIYAAVLDSGNKILYFTNDPKQADRLPAAIEKWRTNLERRRGEGKSEKVAELPVKYTNK